MARLAPARLGGVWRGQAWLGEARQRLQTAARSFCGGSLLLSQREQLWHASVWQVEVGLGVARLGRVWFGEVKGAGQPVPFCIDP